MSNISLDLTGKVDPILVDLFSDLKQVQEEILPGFFVVGAEAGNLILGQGFGISGGRKTNDVEIGVKMNGWDAVTRLRETLQSTGRFVPDIKVWQRFHFKGSLPVDMIPFGEIESPPGSISPPSDQNNRMNVFGYQEAWENALHVQAGEGLSLRIAGLSGMALINLIGWKKGEKASQELNMADLTLIIRNFGFVDHNEARLFQTYSGLMGEESFDLELAGAKLLGHDLSVMMKSNTKELILNILRDETGSTSGKGLADALNGQLPVSDLGRALDLLNSLKLGIEDQRS